jgi:hypothetical protein
MVICRRPAYNDILMHSFGFPDRATLRIGNEIIYAIKHSEDMFCPVDYVRVRHLRPLSATAAKMLAYRPKKVKPINEKQECTCGHRRDDHMQLAPHQCCAPQDYDDECYCSCRKFRPRRKKAR